MIEVKNLTDENIMNISFSANAGEILGVYGLLGSGHQDLGSAIYGQSIRQSGEVLLGGKPVEINNPLDALKLGIAYVPAERKVEGLILGTNVRENLMVSWYAKNSRFGTIDKNAEQKVTAKWIKELQIRTPSGETRAESLSGGNQQKVVLSKCLELEPSVLILNEPTRGIDVGAKTEIYRILDDLCKKGKCIIMITSEMPELLAISDRIMVMYDGRIEAMLDRSEATQENVIKYAIGG
jgi:ABC-type sugar transport system ATPase subunit